MIEFKVFQLEQFNIRWVEKIDAYKMDQLSDYYDKFSSLFIVYNHIYNIVEFILKSNDKLKEIKGISTRGKCKKVFDSHAATKCVAYYLGDKATEILSKLQPEIFEFQEVIEKEKFHIKIGCGEYDRDKDDKLLKGLKSTDPYIQTCSLLELLYSLRCNLFHGDKEFSEKQKAVLTPAIKSLIVLNSSLIDKLKVEYL